LLGSITTNEAIVLASRNAQLVTDLGGLPAPGAREAFDHHIATLSGVVDVIAAEPDWEQKYRVLAALYNAARAEWPRARHEVATTHGSQEWIDGLAAGLDLYARTEGWI
jgi:hypothetical protein